MKKTFLLILISLVCIPVLAKLELPHVVSDNMVLQHNSTVRIWGRANKGSEVLIKVDWQKEIYKSKANNEGEWEVLVKTGEAGGPYNIEISADGEHRKLKNILLGEVWICSGQSNMSMPIRGFNAQPIEGSLTTMMESAAFANIRMFTAERRISEQKEFDVRGDWMVASPNTTLNFSAIGYFYALELHKALQVPIGMINISWGGSNAQAWMSFDLLKMFPEIDIASIDMKSKSPQRIPAALHNAMFYPVSKFTVKGIIWYQGENNIVDYSLYKKIFPAMVEEWRATIGLGNIPFYYVQIAPFKYKGEDLRESAFLREVQLHSQYLIPNSGMVTTGDLGNRNLIHAAKKKDISQRLACWALAKTYGFNNLPHQTPVYRKKEIEGNKVIIHFDFAENGLILQGEPAKVFEIAGSDNVFFPANAKLKGENGNLIEIWSDNVSAPINVRYCFSNYFESVLFNNYMVPVGPFRTDSLSE